jgi:transketolase
VKTIQALEVMANKLRVDSLKSTTSAGSGHPTSCMSCAEIMSCLFFSELQPEDEFILSKGHAAPILWAAFAAAGYIPKEKLETLRRIDSVLEGHPTPRMDLVKVAAGSLGQGLSAGVGMALAQGLRNSKGRIYVLLGDGECAEGSVWEAANSAAYYMRNNICAIIDVNRLGQSAPTMHQHDVASYKQKFEAFGWEAIIIDGHSVQEILDAFTHARKSKKPCVLIAKTIKGKGVSFLEDKEGWHGKPLSRERLEEALKEIGNADSTLPSKSKFNKTNYTAVDFETNKYNLGDMVATRDAFGKALVNLGRKDRNVIAIDADVKNSTMIEYFFKEFPDRGFQTFIAEQNMVGMAVGFSAMGFSPFIATFSAFLTRAHDFIRMAQYSMANIKVVGSHAGISIGPDGPSQMGLEDISMFLSMPEAVVLYPSDAVSAEYLVKEMSRHKGISYLRTTRGKTPVIYKNSERFPIGGLKVVRKDSRDKALVVTAGITLQEALKAYEMLKKKNIYVRVIDLYSLQPFDVASLIKNASECKNNVIAVEDHYCNALGSILSSVLPDVRQLCVRDIPRSGPTEELLKKYGIDASTIVKTAEQIV